VKPDLSNLDEYQQAFLNLKFEVGLIQDIKRLENSDKLLVESIQLAHEDKLRTVCSGIAPYFPDPAVLVNKKVLLFSNLPARKLCNTKSEGMLMCSEKEGATREVEPIDCTEFSVGDVLTLEGIEAELFNWNNNKKLKNVKESWDLVSKGLKSDSEGFILLNTHKLLVNGKRIKSVHIDAKIK